ncbi:MAG: serine hydrolase, partial [Mycetocola sp.]
EAVDLTLQQQDPPGALRAVLVVAYGEPVYERYVESDSEDYWDVRSVTKGVICTLVGIAIDRGLIRDVRATLGELLPRWADHLTPETSAIPLSAVLTHTANFITDSRESAVVWTAPDPIAAILADRATRGAGDGDFRYSDAGSHVLAAVVAEASGMPVLEFALENLFDRLGIVSRPAFEPIVLPLPPEEEEALLHAYDDADFAWPQDQQAVHYGHAFLRLRAPDLARLGQLYLDRGRWDGEQLVSETWIASATTALVTTAHRAPIGHYGYQWWVADREGYFCALGNGGTAIFVDPEHEVVAVVASQIDANQEPGGKQTHDAYALGKAILKKFGTND